MCGIVGYIGKRPVLPVLLGGLEKLEYRGYDSAGVSEIVNAQFEVMRAEGKLAKLKNLLSENGKLAAGENKSAEGVNIGIGHTRWATHGRPSETNAHPHLAGKVCLVHNGIIENYVELKAQLTATKCVFKSETDSEIAAHLINSHIEQGLGLFAATKTACSEMQGSYALVVMSLSEPDKLVVAKNATPVIVGITPDESFIASDIPAILEYTRDFYVLEDGDFAEISRGAIKIEHEGVAAERKPITIAWDPITAEKGGFEHFMLKEIHEQPRVVMETLRGRLDQEHSNVHFDDVFFSDDDFAKIERIVIVACGTAWHAALTTKFYIEKFARMPVDVDYASEFRYRNPLLNDKTLFIAISQSGETADTLGALQIAIEKGAKTLAICNVVGSTIARRAGNIINTQAGPEISVASTKAFVTQLVAGYLLALKLALVRNTLSADELANYIDQVVHLPKWLTAALGQEDKIKDLAQEFSKSFNFLYLARGLLYPIALEGALKLKEISYIHAEGYPAGEMKHGPIALITEETPVVVVLGHDDGNYEKAMSNLTEAVARKAKIIAVTDLENAHLSKLAHRVIAVGDIPSQMLPIVLVIPLQLLAYYTAICRETDVDQPRNLAKSVTVE
ncbi:MAG: glutamine--fructose-6-phosphate transaminase (isomerizing) [Deltaproteobacteria bacterium]|nr:glutamine--fructose-6-phosphate transaminase (isomerizing) [Deltaproteobacteria bacterium]